MPGLGNSRHETSLRHRAADIGAHHLQAVHQGRTPRQLEHRQRPDCDPQEQCTTDGQQILETRGHHLVDTQPRQGPPHPHLYKDQQTALGDKHLRSQQVGQQVPWPAGLTPTGQNRFFQAQASVPAPQEQRRGHAADREHAGVFGHEEVRPANAAVFGVEPGHQFALGFSQVERSSLHARRRHDEVDEERDEAERVVEDHPVQERAGLNPPQVHQAQGPGGRDGHQGTNRHRDFVADHLGRFTHSPEQRPLRAARIARQDDPHHLQRHDGQHEKQANVEVLGNPAIGPGKHQERRERGHEDQVRRHPEQHPVGRFGTEIFLLNQLDPVGEGLQPAEFTPDPRWPQSILDSSRDLAFQPDVNKGRHAKEAQHQSRMQHSGQQIRCVG